jgi:hypothetical protein
LRLRFKAREVKEEEALRKARGLPHIRRQSRELFLKSFPDYSFPISDSPSACE